MTAYDPLYLLTLYSPRSVDPDEATVLTPTPGAPHTQPFRVATRHFGKAVRIGATTGRYLIRNPVGTWPTTALTIEYYGRLDSSALGTAPNFALSYAITGLFNEILFGVQSTGGTWRPYLEINQLSAGTATPVWPTDAKYHHLAARWRSSDGSTQIFLDGVQVLTATLKTGYSIVGGGAFVVGQEQDALGAGFDATQAWKGEIDEARLYNRFLSDAEIKQHAGGIYIDETGLCGRWGFDLPGVPGLGRDSSSAGNDLTPVGITEGTEDTVLHFFPYLDIPRGRNGRIAPLERKLDSGEWAFPLIDKRVDDDTPAGLKRWLTAFLGNAKGQPRLAGLKFVANASFDGGLIVEPWRAGRLSSVAVGPVNATLAARDVTDEAKMAIFTGAPHSSITYAARQAVCPVGIMGADYGTIKAVTPLKGTARTITINALGQLPATYTRVSIDTSVARPDNIATRQLVNAAAPNDSAGFVPSTVLGGDSIATLPNFSGPLRARVKHTSGAANGQTGDYKAAGLGYAQGPNGKLRLAQVALESLDAGDVNQLAVPANGVTVEVTLWVDGPASKDNPLFLNDVHFATLLQDLCDGKFGYLYRSPESLPGGKSYGDPKRTVPLANGAAFIADTTYPKQRFVITKRDELITWVEKNILKPLNVALYADEQGRLAIVDLRLPATLAGVPALTETDLARDKPQGDWSFDRENVISRVEFTRYSDRPMKLEELTAASGTFPDMPPGLIESFDHPLIVLDVGATDVGDRAYEVDAPGFRSMDGETMEGQARGVYLENKLVELANQWRRPFGWGLIELPVTLRRGGATVTPGGLVTATFLHVPDPTTWQRGGTRVCRALEVSPEGAERRVVLLDLGMSQIAIAPTLGAPAQETNNTYTGVTTVLTLNGDGQAAEVRYAVTDTGVGTVPVDTSPLWTVFGRFTTNQTVTIRKLPANKRVWVQGRTLPDYIDGQQPSAWTNAAGSGRVDTDALPAPSAPAASLQTARAFRVSWTNGAAELATELLIATPTTDPRVVVARVLPGSTLYDFPGDTGLVLSPSTTYRVGVRHVLVNRSGVGGVSAEVTVDPVTTASEPIIQPPIRQKEYY